MHFGKIIISLLCTVCCLQATEPKLLQTSDVKNIMQQIFKKHIEKKEMTRSILKNALIIYIEQFDVNRLYLLESEVVPYLKLSDEQLELEIKKYQQNDFSLFRQLNQLIQTAIKRSQKMRKNIENNIENGQLKAPGSIQHTAQDLQFVTTLAELNDRTTKNLWMFIENQKNNHHDLKQSIALYEANKHKFEETYLLENDAGQSLPLPEQENLINIHIIKALANSIDSHTSFYEASEAYDLRIHLQKEFRGLGLVIKSEPPEVIVDSILPNSAAARSGLIKPGDILLAIDNVNIEQLPFDKVIESLHDQKESKRTLKLKRKNKLAILDETYQVILQPELILLNNDRVDVSSEKFGDGIIGKITLHSFYQGEGISSEQDVRDAIKKLQKEGNLKGLILDLRDNLGGFLSQAVKVAGLFISNGVIVIAKYAQGEEHFYRDVDGLSAYDGPLVILTSKTTASAAEIVAQALQDYGVGLVVGDVHTYGKGTIQTQTVTDNQTASYFKVTVGKYYTVSGHTPQKQGVKADIVVPSHWDHIEVGETDDSQINPKNDIIPPAFTDQLQDVATSMRGWYLKHYIPTLQKRIVTWQELLPILRKNSEYRITQNKNYMFYLNGGLDQNSTDNEEEWSGADQKVKNYGEDNLQMQEAVNILKDMILLHKTELTSPNAPQRAIKSNPD